MKFSNAGVIALGAGIATVLVGCGASTIDGAKVESTVSEEIQQIFPDAQVAVTCPSDIPIDPQGTFECIATVDGQELPISVTQEDDQGNVTYEQAAAFVDLSAGEQQITEQLTAQIPGNWTVDCSQPGVNGTVYFARPGSTFDCTVSGQSSAGEDQQAVVEVTVDDIDGNVSWELL